ncbi:MAG: hypothetical protein ABJM26_13770 [Anderseniella sp.]
MTIKRGLLILFMLLATTTIAVADQIDGTWCSPSGASMTVEGTRIVTPGGNVVTGRYNRHHVDYEVPEGETDAGGRVSADQLNDEQIRVIVMGKDPAANAPSEIWTKCQVTS